MFKTMLVEDNVIFREYLRDSLQRRFPSMEIAKAGNGEEALEKVGSPSPNLIFMDIRLPGENGLELTEKIKTLHPDIKIIIVTNYDIPEYREAAARFKADHFFSKDSMTIEEVVTLVKSYLMIRFLPTFNRKSSLPILGEYPDFVGERIARTHEEEGEY